MSTSNEKSKDAVVGPLKVHKSYIYNNKTGERLIYRGANAWLPESDDEFLARFQKGEEVSLEDLERCCKLHPLITEYSKNGKDFMATITGIIERVPYREVFKNTGFNNWQTFRAMTEWECPGLKSIFELAMKEREESRLSKAEEALEKRAIDGVDEPVWAPNGKFLGNRKRFSDRLLEVHLKALDPDKYSEKHKVDVEGMVVAVSLGLRDADQPFKRAEDLSVSPSPAQSETIPEETDSSCAKDKD